MVDLSLLYKERQMGEDLSCRHVVMLTSSDSGYFCGTQDLSNGLHQDGSIGH